MLIANLIVAAKVVINKQYKGILFFQKGIQKAMVLYFYFFYVFLHCE